MGNTQLEQLSLEHKTPHQSRDHQTSPPPHEEGTLTPGSVPKMFILSIYMLVPGGLGGELCETLPQ